MTGRPHGYARFGDLLGEAFDRHWTDRERLTVSQWAERYRVVAAGGPYPGPWRNAHVPFLAPSVECVCALHDGHAIVDAERVVEHAVPGVERVDA